MAISNRLNLFANLKNGKEIKFYNHRTTRIH